MPPSRPIEERFWEKVDKRGPDDCWLWTGAVSRGYGNLGGGPEKPSVRAHVLSYRMHRGPTGKNHVLHTCDTKRCCNPSHLFLGTHQDNMADMNLKGRQAKGTRIAKSKLTEDDVRAIRRDWRPGLGEQLARRHHVSGGTISRIVNRKIWKHV